MYVCLYFKRNPLAPKIAKQFHLVFNCFGCGHTYSDGAGAAKRLLYKSIKNCCCWRFLKFWYVLQMLVCVTIWFLTFWKQYLNIHMYVCMFRFVLGLTVAACKSIHFTWDSEWFIESFYDVPWFGLTFENWGIVKGDKLVLKFDCWGREDVI